MKRIFSIAFFLVFAHLAVGQEINFKRVCNGGNNNQLFWQNISGPCTLLSTIKIKGRDASSFPYYGIDSGINVVPENYTHLNSNVPSVKDWEYYIEYKIVCGPDTFTRYTDTLRIDDQKPDSTILDSVSVDPTLNIVYLGWTSNKTIDFSSYYLYNYDRTDPRLVENYKDTFYKDLNPINPKTKSLSYDITSSDSCDNRRDYGNYKHQTIFLTGTIDTCVNRVSLNWTNYIGWNARTYYIYRKDAMGNFYEIDSVLGSQLSYIDATVNSNSTYEYYVRAYKVGVPFSSSSSNSSTIFSSGMSTNPSNTLITQVSNNTNNKLELQLKRNPLANYSNIDLFRSAPNNSPVFVHSFSGNEDIYEDAGVNNTIRFEYYLLSKNMCGIITDTSSTSNNIVLEIEESGDNLLLKWNPYFTWNAGVQKHLIYRATGNTVNEASNFVAIQNNVADTFYTEAKPSLSVACYYVIAEESGGTATSRSNQVCFIKTGNIYYPNAIAINGINRRFNFVGEGIDLNLSSIQVYNRWGVLEYSKENIANGWDGRNNQGELLNGDVYYFTAKINQGLNTINLHGNITILR